METEGGTGSSPTGVTALCPSARHINPSLLLVQPGKTRPYITERLLMGLKESNQTKNKSNHSCSRQNILSQPYFHFDKIWLDILGELS